MHAIGQQIIPFFSFVGQHLKSPRTIPTCSILVHNFSLIPGKLFAHYIFKYWPQGGGGARVVLPFYNTPSYCPPPALLFANMPLYNDDFLPFPLSQGKFLTWRSHYLAFCRYHNQLLLSTVFLRHHSLSAPGTNKKCNFILELFYKIAFQ